jgi:hypothetical protein
MENQNSTPQEKKRFFSFHGKKGKVVVGVIAVLLLFGFVGRGMAAHSAWSAKGHPLMRMGNVALAAKDFESAGIVFAESAAAMREGQRKTYNARMKEAAKKDADAIINVTIASKKEAGKRIWYGSATAIKYLDTIPGETSSTPAFGMYSGRTSGTRWHWN